MLCARRTQLIQRRRCVTCVSRVCHPRCWWTAAAARVCDVCQALRAPSRKKGACVLVRGRWLLDTATAVVESPDLKSRQTASNHLS
ncbi:unnamed protein product [Ectocarpus sp. 13 AM-2016]